MGEFDLDNCQSDEFLRVDAMDSVQADVSPLPSMTGSDHLCMAGGDLLSMMGSDLLSMMGSDGDPVCFSQRTN